MPRALAVDRRYSPDPVPAEVLPFGFYTAFFQHFREMVIASPYPIRPNWFRTTHPACSDRGDTATGIEFSIVAAREKDYLLIARLDSTYWECLRTAPGPLNFSFQLLQVEPKDPTLFSLRGFYDLNKGLVHLGARKDNQDVWHPTTGFQVFQEPGSPDIAFQITDHPQLPPGQRLLRITSTMLLIPHSFWIGLPGECLELADWEVHANRQHDRFLLDVVLPATYLDCLQQTADGFEFEVAFFQ